MRRDATLFVLLGLLAIGWTSAGLAYRAAQAPAAPAKAPAGKPQPSSRASDGRRAEFLKMFARGYFPGRTAQLMVVPREGDIITRDEADIRYMHGSPWPYDTAIPLFFVGGAVRPGTYRGPAAQQDVAVTVARVIDATMPPTANGRVLPVVRPGARPPRAVLILVLDGMRIDYFSRYAGEMPRMTALRRKSAWFADARVNALPTNTAVGHSTIATGTDPRVHGITGNNLYDSTRKARHDMFEGWDPGDMETPSLADVWQLQTRGRAIVIGQGSSVPAGTALAGHGACQLNGHKTVHAGYDERSGRWRTNGDCFVSTSTLADLDARTLWPADGLWRGHKIDTPSAVRRSGLFPGFETEAFLRLIQSRAVGQDEVTDLLLLNFKGADYVGHKHGPESPELAATLAAMDEQLGRILDLLEERTKGDYLLAVTADHGMPSEPPAGRVRRFAPVVLEQLNARFDPERRALATYYEPENAQIFVSHDRLAELKLTLRDLAAFLESQPFMFAVFTEDEVRTAAKTLTF